MAGLYSRVDRVRSIRETRVDGDADDVDVVSDTDKNVDLVEPVDAVIARERARSGRLTQGMLEVGEMEVGAASSDVGGGEMEVALEVDKVDGMTVPVYS